MTEPDAPRAALRAINSTYSSDPKENPVPIPWFSTMINLASISRAILAKDSSSGAEPSAGSCTLLKHAIAFQG